MIIKGRLTHLSRHCRHVGYGMEYDFIQIGDTRIEHVMVDRDMIKLLQSLIDHDIEISIMPKRLFLTHHVAVVRSVDGTVYYHKNALLTVPRYKRYLILGYRLLLWFGLPYLILLSLVIILFSTLDIPHPPYGLLFGTAHLLLIRSFDQHLMNAYRIFDNHLK